MSLRYRRILLKCSGEALMGREGFGLDLGVVSRIAAEIAAAREAGAGVGVVIGGGNIIRGVLAATQGLSRASADYMGMLATVINGLAMQGALEQGNVACRVQSSIPMMNVCEPYIRRKALRHLEKGRVVIFSGGTGNPFFTTDTAAALRALEIGADILLKGTRVDGVYSDDPLRNSAAVRYSHLTYQEALVRNVGVMDTSAISLARDGRLPIGVFSLEKPGELGRIIRGQGTCTLISDGQDSTGDTAG